MKIKNAISVLLISMILLLVYLPTFVSADDDKLDISATLILRPNADGGYQSWTPKNGDGHYAEVDDVTSDGSTTELHQFNMFDATIETWNIQNPPESVSGLTINSVTIHEIVSTASSGRQVELVYWATDEIGVMGSPVKTITAIYPSNWEEITWTPNRGKPWTWDVITSLQIGIVSANTGGTGWRYITQAWLEVNYASLTVSNEVPTNTTTDISIGLSSVSVDITGQPFNWTIGGENITTNSSIDDITGTKTANVIGPLAYDTQYNWWTNVSIGNNYINNTYWFMTESAPPTPPTPPTQPLIDNGYIADDNARIYARATDGTLYAVYEKHTETEEGNFVNIYLASSTDNGTAWSNISISDNDISYMYSYSETIATGQNGSIYIAWIYENNTVGDTYQVQCRFYQTNSWSNILNVTGIFETGAFYGLAIAVDNLDNVHIVYRCDDYDSGYQTIQYVTYDGESFSEPYQISDESYDAHAPSIAIDGNDIVYVSWSSYDSYCDSSFIQYTFKDFRGWSDIYDVTSPSGSYDCYKTAIAIGTDNTVHLVYSNFSYDTYEGYFQYVAINYDTWTGPQNVCEPGYTGGGSLTVSVDSFDRIYVVWDGYNPDTDIYGIMLNVWDESWDSPEMLVNNISDTYCNLLSATHPTYEVESNVPYSGYTFVFYDDVFQSIYCYFNATWQEPSGFPSWDINQDGVVNYLDVSSLVSHYGQSGTPSWIPEDINDDGVVNYLDVSSLVSHYGESY